MPDFSLSFIFIFSFLLLWLRKFRLIQLSCLFMSSLMCKKQYNVLGVFLKKIVLCLLQDYRFVMFFNAILTFNCFNWRVSGNFLLKLLGKIGTNIVKFLVQRFFRLIKKLKNIFRLLLFQFLSVSLLGYVCAVAQVVQYFAQPLCLLFVGLIFR